MGPRRTLRIGVKLAIGVGAMGVIALGLLAASIAALRDYDEAVRAAKNASERAQIAERVNGLVYAVVMDSRGIYMSPDTGRARPFAEGIRRFLGEFGRDIARWESLLPDHQRAAFAPLRQAADDFIRLRLELARLGVEESIEAANRIGNNEENRRNRQALNAALERVAQASAAEIQAAAAAVEGRAERLALWLAIGTLVGLGLAGLAVWVTVSRGVVRPLHEVGTALEALSSGQTNVTVPGVERSDEIGALARAAERFRTALQERAALERDRLLEAQAKEARAAATASEVARFKRESAALLDELGRSAVALESAVVAMRQVAHASSDGAAAVGVGAAKASAHVATVAAAAEGLSSSIVEITRRVSESARIASDAVTKARETDETVRGLAESAKRIGDVVRLINDIAGRTNLLALNATIEAARAGEAGKGFAVVASEVKNLATQTAKATEEIAGQIGTIQSETERAVAAIAAIGAVIEDVSRLASAIAAAVEEQGAATREMAQNIQEAAAGTNEVSARIADVGRAGQEAGAQAALVEQTAKGVSGAAERLSNGIAGFLSRVEAA